MANSINYSDSSITAAFSRDVIITTVDIDGI